MEDSGKYLCMVNNSVGGESVETVLTVTGYFLIIYLNFYLYEIISKAATKLVLKLRKKIFFGEEYYLFLE